jgi:2,3-bisphosphoglycerate-independent phosphoglycerate mutase
VLLILDGWGLAGTGDPNWPDPEAARAHSAIELAQTPVWHRLLEEWPHTQLIPHGEAVGLTSGQMGNSEVGHLNLGAGRVVYQDLVAVTRIVEGGKLHSHRAFQDFLTACAARGGTLHFIGLFSDGGVHSHIRHLKGMAQEAARSNPAGHIRIHALLDGRDTEPRLAEQYFEAAEDWLPENTKFASLGGRYFGMDRDKRWERLQLAWEVIVHGSGPRAAGWRSALAAARQRDEGDEFVTPTVLGDYNGMRDGDSVIFFNFRADRARQLFDAMSAGEQYSGFQRGEVPRLAFFSTKHYRDDFTNPVLIEDHPVSETLCEVVSKAGASNYSGGRVYKSAETEKYAHVTYFFNGGIEQPWPGEDRVLVPSPKVATYDLQPEMSVYEVTEKLCAALRAGRHDLYVVNFANGDMVGHTGVKSACIEACEAVDECLLQVLEAADWGRRVNCIITADHGNCDVLCFADGTPHTQHSMNNSPLVLVSSPRRELRPVGQAARPGPAFPQGRAGWSLCDVAPTVLELLGIPQPESWSGQSLLA